MPFFKPKSYLGIDIGAGGIKLVELRQEKKRPVLFTYGLTSEKQDVHKLVVKNDLTVKDLIKKDTKENSASNKTGSNTDQGKISDQQVDKYAALIKAVCKTAKTTSKIAAVSLPVSSPISRLTIS